MTYIDAHISLFLPFQAAWVLYDIQDAILAKQFPVFEEYLHGLQEKFENHQVLYFPAQLLEKVPSS